MGKPPLLEQFRVNDGVGHASFIFQTDEHESFGGAGALTADNQSRDTNVLSVSAMRQITGRDHLGELFSNEGHGVASSGRPVPAKSASRRSKASMDARGAGICGPPSRSANSSGW